MSARSLISSLLRSATALAGVVLALSLLSLGCVVMPHHQHGHETGPPPWAPAHGHRAKHGDHHQGNAKLVFDSGLGVYLVMDMPDYYFFNEFYFHYDQGRWMVSSRLDGGWRVAESKKLPPGLAKRGKGRGHQKRGGPPARHH